MRRLNHIFWILWLTNGIVLSSAILHSCKPSTQKFSGKKNPSGERSPSVADGRPTEDSDGIEGYLTDPAAIVVRKNVNGPTTVSAPQGAVRAENGPSERVRTGIWSLVFNESDLGGGNVAARPLICIFPNPDGSFEVNVNAAPNELVVVTAGVRCSRFSRQIEGPRERQFAVSTPTKTFNMPPPLISVQIVFQIP